MRRRQRLTLETLDGLQYSIDVERHAERTLEAGWAIDDYAQPLPGERPGEPERGGPWQTAVAVVEGYEFADPRLIRATWDPGSPLQDRSMLLEARFLGLRFLVGTRVYRVVDECRVDADGAHVRARGWGYATLTGHFETGTMDYEVRKRLSDGAVEFRVHVVSRRAAVRNPLIRIGFRLVGRRLQRRFARTACRRVATLVGQRTAARAREAAGAL